MGPENGDAVIADGKDDIAPEDELGDLPGRSKAEIGASIVSAGISSVPVVGDAAAELFELVLAPSLGKRRDDWLRKLGEVVAELRQRLAGFDPRDLEGNEHFVSAVLAASTLAMKTHQEEKLEMLRNALVNVVLPRAPDEHEQMNFLRFVDELTPLHVQILRFLEDPNRWYESARAAKPTFSMGGLGAVLFPAFRQFSEHTLEAALFDLDQRRLSDAASSLGVTMTNAGVWASRIRPLGARFLAFVSSDRRRAA
jgi:hypothetical protein